MFRCANCERVLDRCSTDEGIMWDCGNCHGRFSSHALLRKVVPRPLANELWQLAREEGARTGRDCPSCTFPMRVVRPRSEEDLPWLDVCSRCHMVWFDPAEFELLPRLAADPVEEEPPEVRQAAAVMQVMLNRDRMEREVNASGWPDLTWQSLPGLLGLPVEADAPEKARVPVVTFALGLLVLAIGAMTMLGGLEAAVQQYGFIPAEAGRLGGLTFLTSFFLHGGVVHLLGNLYFLITFGDNVEDYLGRERFVLLLLGATLLGALAHMAGDPQSTTPCVGASGGISGVIAFYALKFPRVRLGFMLWLFPFFRWIQISAVWAFILWLGLQFLGTWQQLAGFSNVSSLAHLGGAAAGVLCWVVFRNR